LAQTLEALGEPAAAEDRYVEAIEILEEQNWQSHHQYRVTTRAYRDFARRHGQAAVE
jgi:hypothetical protein